MSLRFLIVLLMALFAGMPRALPAQEVLDQIRALSSGNAQAYASPLVEGLNLAITGGFADRARPMKPFGFDLSFRILAALPSAEQERFTAILPDSFVWNGTSYLAPYETTGPDGTSPTIVGTGVGATLAPQGAFERDLLQAGLDPDDFRVILPGGLDLPAVPLVVFQGAVGVGFGTEVALRFLPAVEISPEVGALRSHGLSVHHAVSHWFSSPVDLMVTLGLQDASAGHYLQSTSTSLGLLAGVNAGPMSFLGGTLLRDASTELRWKVENPGENPALPADGLDLSFQSQARGDPSYLLGARLQLLALNLSGHYLFGSYRLVSLKLGLGLP